MWATLTAAGPTGECKLLLPAVCPRVVAVTRSQKPHPPARPRNLGTRPPTAASLCWLQPQRARGPRALQLQPAVGLSRAGAAALPTGLHPAPGGAGAAGRGKEEKVGRRLLVCLAYRCDPVYMISALCRTPGKRLLRRSQLAHGAPLLPTAPLCSPWRPTVLCVSTQPTSIQQLKVRPLLVHVLQVFFCPPHHPSPVGPCLSPCSCATRLTRLLFHEPVTRHSPPTLPAPVLHCPCLRPLFVPAGLNSFDCFAPFDLDDKFKAPQPPHPHPHRGSTLLLLPGLPHCFWRPTHNTLLVHSTTHAHCHRTRA